MVVAEDGHDCSKQLHGRAQSHLQLLPCSHHRLVVVALHAPLTRRWRQAGSMRRMGISRPMGHASLASSGSSWLRARTCCQL